MTTQYASLPTATRSNPKPKKETTIFTPVNIRQPDIDGGKYCIAIVKSIFNRMARLPVDPPGLACSDEEWHRSKKYEHHIARHTQPSDKAHGIVGHKLYRACMPVAVVYHVPELDKSRREQTEGYHHGQTDVESPERAFYPGLYRCPLRIIQILAESIYTQSKREETKYSEQCGMPVIGSKICADFEIAHNRHVDEKTEHPGSDEVPESDCHEVIEHPFMLLTDTFGTSDT